MPSPRLGNGSGMSVSGPQATFDSRVPAGPRVGLRPSGGLVLMFWPVDGNSYEVEEAANGLDGGWRTTSVEVFEVDGQKIAVLPRPNAHSFYRLRQR
jgi:hypothetical protein